MNVHRQGSECRLQIIDDPIFREFDFSRLVMAALKDSDQHVILDLTLVATLHSPGLANLVSIHVSLQKRGKKLSLLGLNEHNRRLLRVTNLDQLLTIAAS